MTDAAPPPIRLADTADFDLGGMTVRPSRGLVEWSGGAERLEPRVMQVLVALHLAEGRVVGRDELIARCWEGRIVGEDAINRTLGRLRALGRDSGGTFEIETIARVGYLLKPAPTTAAPLADAGRRGRLFGSRTLWMASGAAVVLGVALIVAFASARPAPRWEVGEYGLLIAGPEDERAPALTRDGRFLAYTQGGPGGVSEIWSRAVSGGEPIRLVEAAGEAALSPAWSPDGDAIAFVRVDTPPGTGNAPCRIYVKPYPQGLERLVGRCEYAPWTPRLSWTADGRALVYSEWLDITTFGSRLRRMDLRTGEITDITRPGPRERGDGMAAVSPDGSRVAFMRRFSNVSGDVFVMGLDGRNLTQITHGLSSNWVEWSPDGKNLLVTASRFGASELWAYDSRGEGEPTRLLVGLQDVYRMSAADDRVVFETVSHAMEIVRLGEETETTVASGARYSSVDVAADGTVAFISLDPKPHLWLQRPGRPAQRLTDLSMAGPRYLMFSPDGRRLTMVGEVEGDSDIYIVEVESGAITRLRSPDIDVSRASWTPDGRALVRSGIGPNGGGIARLDGLSEQRAVSLIGTGWPLSQVTAEGVFGSSLRHGGIWRIRPGAAPEEIAPVQFANTPWRVARGAVYTLDARGRPGTALIRRALPNGAPSERMVGAAHEFAIDPSNGDALVIRTVQRRQDIGMVTLRRR